MIRVVGCQRFTDWVSVSFGFAEIVPRFYLCSKLSLDFIEISGFCWIKPDFKEILADLNEIRPDLEKILADLDEIKPDLEEIRRDLV